jgi:hypothetical protein
MYVYAKQNYWFDLQIQKKGMHSESAWLLYMYIGFMHLYMIAEQLTRVGAGVGARVGAGVGAAVGAWQQEHGSVSMERHSHSTICRCGKCQCGNCGPLEHGSIRTDSSTP